jgi:two-component system chemotaxis response regulator CheY
LLTAIVVDDDTDLTEVFSELLGIHNIRVLGIGHNGKDALNLYGKFKPDIVFLDINMPEYDGFYGLAGIKMMNHDAFVVAITVDNTSAKKLFELGASEVICKPFHVPSILDKIIKTHFLGKKKTENDWV